MKVLNFKDFMKKYNSKSFTMIESELQRIYIYTIYPRDFEIHSNKGIVNIDDGSVNGTHWTCFITKHKKSYYFDSFCGQPDKFSLNQIPKPIYQNYKIEDKISKLCGSYCLYFIYLIEGMNYYDYILKMCFDKINSN